MHKKFEINPTKIKGGCQSGRKVVTHNYKSDLPLVLISNSIFDRELHLEVLEVTCYVSKLFFGHFTFLLRKLVVRIQMQSGLFLNAPLLHFSKNYLASMYTTY